MNQPRRAKTALATLLALSLAASACGDDADEGFSSDTTAANGYATTTEADSGDAEFELTDQTSTTSAAGDDGFFVDSSRDSSDEAARSTAPASGGFFTDAEAPEPSITEDNIFENYGVRGFVATDRDPFSTFALDVDTGSYSIARTWLNNGEMPPVDSVRVEEYVNSFSYDYRSPADGLNVIADAGPSPFNEDNIILRLGVAAEDVRNSQRPDASLTFLIDTSGSMDRQDRIELVKESLETLVNELDGDDSVAIVTFSTDARLLLEPTSVRNRDEIISAIRSLRPNGNTNLEAGLRQAYELADEAYDQGGINRVILASDGVANVGLTDPDGLSQMIRDDADRGIQLVTLGVGMGNFNDVLMETLADDGDGFYAYANTVEEAERIFTDDLVSTLLTVAIDGKIQVEFNPDAVESYRLIGYENRGVLDENFRNDAVDAGELGAGHEATAIYELELRDGVRNRDELGTAMLRWEDPDTGKVIEGRLELSASIIAESWSDTDDDFRLAVVVATFAEILRDSPFAANLDLSQVLAEAEALRGGDDVVELEELIRMAQKHKK